MVNYIFCQNHQNDYGEITNKLRMAMFIKNFENHSDVIQKFYSEFYEEFLEVDIYYGEEIVNYINVQSNRVFKNFSIDFYDSPDVYTFVLSLTKDTYEFIQREFYYYNERYMNTEAKLPIIDLIEALTGDDVLYEYAIASLDEWEITDYAYPFIMELDLVEFVEETIALDKEISFRKFLFKLLGLNRNPNVFLLT